MALRGSGLFAVRAGRVLIGTPSLFDLRRNRSLPAWRSSAVREQGNKDEKRNPSRVEEMLSEFEQVRSAEIKSLIEFGMWIWQSVR